MRANPTPSQRHDSRAQQGRNEGGKGAQFPEKSQQCHKYFLQEHICFRKTSGSNRGAPNLLLAPGAI